MYIIGFIILISFGLCGYIGGKTYLKTQNIQQRQLYTQAVLEKEYRQSIKKMYSETRTLFQKYGATISYDDILKLSNICEKAQSKEEIASIIFSFIPDNVPTLDSINVYATAYADKILALCSNNELKNYLKERYEENISAITDNDLNNIYNAQKNSQVPGQENIFRFNFELFAFIIIFHELDDVSPFLFSQTELDAFKYVLLKFGDDNGYALNTHVLLGETIQHFKDFFRKYGVTLSPEEVAHIMTQYAIAQSEGKADEILFQYIPDEIPSLDKFVEELAYHIKALLSKLPNTELNEKISNMFNESINEYSSSLVYEFYEAQKSTYSISDQNNFRFNYQLCAFVMIFSICDDLANSIEYADSEALEPLNKFTQSLLDFGNTLGYARLD